jgi:hypothetical protein
MRHLSRQPAAVVDSARLRDDYVSTGFKGYQPERPAVPGHQFGLRLSPEDKRALIARS